MALQEVQLGVEASKKPDSWGVRSALWFRQKMESYIREPYPDEAQE